MLQFPVPQFIDIEDKLIGPLSLKQFGFILPGGLLIFIFFRIFKISPAFFFLSLPVLLVTLGVGFGRFNGKPVYDQFGVFVKFLTSPKRYQFSKNPGTLDDLNIGAINIEEVQQKITKAPVLEESAQSKLRKLTMMLDQKSQEEQEITSISEREKE